MYEKIAYISILEELNVSLLEWKLEEIVIRYEENPYRKDWFTLFSFSKNNTDICDEELHLARAIYGPNYYSIEYPNTIGYHPLNEDERKKGNKLYPEVVLLVNTMKLLIDELEKRNVKICKVCLDLFAEI